MIQRKADLLKQIKNESIRLDWEVAFGGKSYGNKHLYRVNKIAKYLQKYEGGDLFLVLASAWCHDVTLAFGIDDDPQKIAGYTKEFLTNFKELREDEITSIVKIAMEHERGGSGISLEAQIVHDADVIDKSGMLGVVRHIWKTTNMIKERILEGENDLGELERDLIEREKKVFTESAKKIVLTLNAERYLFFASKSQALEMLYEISKLADKGITSDDISLSLTKNLDYPCVIALNNQLSCGYLH